MRQYITADKSLKTLWSKITTTERWESPQK